jgi:hypothetical protein
MPDLSVLDSEYGRSRVLLERAASLVERGCRCRECGRVIEGGVSLIDCEGRCSLDGLSREEIAAAIRALLQPRTIKLPDPTSYVA